MRPRQAYTLLEIIVALTLFALIMTLGVKYLIPVMRASVRATLRVEMEQQAVAALNRLVMDLGRTTPPGISLRSTAPPVAVGICPLSTPDLRPGLPRPVQADGTLVWANFFILYYFDPTSRQLRRREWPPGSVPATSTEVSILQPRRLSSDRLAAVLAGSGTNETVLATQVESFDIVYPPGGNDDLRVQPITFRLVLQRKGNTGRAEPETFTYTRTVFVRNQRT